jgi:hypothetical protein
VFRSTEGEQYRGPPPGGKQTGKGKSLTGSRRESLIGIPPGEERSGTRRESHVTFSNGTSVASRVLKSALEFSTGMEESE